jgi:hypothetical protein
MMLLAHTDSTDQYQIQILNYIIKNKASFSLAEKNYNK